MWLHPSTCQIQLSGRKAYRLNLIQLLFSAVQEKPRVSVMFVNWIFLSIHLQIVCIVYLYFSIL